MSRNNENHLLVKSAEKTATEKSAEISDKGKKVLCLHATKVLYVQVIPAKHRCTNRACRYLVKQLVVYFTISFKKIGRN